MRSWLAGGFALALCVTVQAQSLAAPPPAAAALEDGALESSASSRTPLVPRSAPDVLDDYRADSDFQYADPEAKGPSLWQRFWDWVDRTIWGPIRDSTTATGRQVVFVFVAILGLGWAVARLLRAEGSGGVFSRSSRPTPSVGLLDVEDIAEVDLSARLREALASGDHREAVRVRYLEVLQVLDAARALEWRRDKTNRQYVLEVARLAPEHAAPFQQATRVFDAVWYGERPVSAALYGRLVPLFEAASPESVSA